MQGEDLLGGPHIDIRLLNLTSRRCWQLQQCFSSEVLPWCPIMDQQTCSELVSRVSQRGFDPQDTETPLVLFMLALGSFAQDHHHMEDDSATFPGIEYFRAGSQLIDLAPYSSRNTIHMMQSHILRSCYLLHALRPIQAYETVRLASTKIIMFLQLRRRLNADPALRELVHRSYWAAYVIEHELQAWIPYSSRILQDLHEHVPLPTSDYDEPGIYWFVAEIAIRRIFARPRHGVGWNLVHTLYEPTIADEISHRLSEWHASLPSPISFPLEQGVAGESISMRPLLDPRKVFLRAQYYAFQAIIFWPNVVRLLTFPLAQGGAGQYHHGSFATPGGMSDCSSQPAHKNSATEDDLVIEAAARSLRFAVLHIYAAESLFQSRNMVVLSSLVGLQCMALLLLSTCGSPLLKSLGIVHPCTEDVIRVAWRSLKPWMANLPIRGRIEQLECLMQAAGIAYG